MMNLDRLLLRINAVLDGDTGGFEARDLASEYTTLTESVRERLRQCVALIKAGNDHAALQVAEAEPPVLDLASKLAFDRSARWREYCRANRLPSPARIEDRLVELTNNLYSREIGESHPLYREYRSAVRERDDRRALGVLRSIARINSSDKNARDEYARLSAKLRREHLERLAGELRAGDTDAVLGTIKAMESAGLGPCPDEAAWRDAVAVREKTERARALDEALALVPRISACRDAGDVEGAAPLLGRARSLEKQFGFVWPEPAGETVADAERRITALALEAETRRLAKERAEALIRRLDTLEDEAADAARTGSALAETSRNLGLWLAEARAEDGFSADEIGRATTLSAAVGARSARGRKRVLLTFGALVAASALVVAFGAAKFAAYKHARDFGESLARAEKSPEAGAVATFLDEARTRRSELAASPEYKTRIAALETRAKESAKSLSQAAEELESLKHDAREGRVPPRTLKERAAALDVAVEALPKDYRLRLSADVDAITARIDGDAIGVPTARIESGLAKAGDAFVPDAPFVAATAALAEALKSPGAAPKETVERGRAALDAARKHVSEAEAAAAAASAAKDATAKIDSAKTLADYLSGLTALAAVPGSPDAAAATKAGTASEALGKLPGPLTPKDTAAMIAALKPGKADLFLAPDPTAAESANAGAFAALAKYAGVWKAIRTVYAKEGGSVGTAVWLAGKPVAERAELTGGEEIRMTAKRLRTDGTTEPLETKTIRFEGRAPSGDMLEESAVAPEGAVLEAASRLYDADRNVFNVEPLGLLDKALAADVSPLLKGWIHRQLADILAERPDAWGAVFSPEFREDAASVAAILPAQLPREAWMTPERYPEATRKLEAFYARKRAPYLPAATRRAALVRAVADAGVAYAGHAGADGAPVLREGALAPGDRIFGLDESGNPAVLGETGADGAPKLSRRPAAFSPLLKLALSPDKAAPGGDATALFLPKP